MQTKATALFRPFLITCTVKKPLAQFLCNKTWTAIRSQVVLLNWKFASHMVRHDHNELTQGKVNISYLLHYYSGLNKNKKTKEKHIFYKTG